MKKIIPTIFFIFVTILSLKANETEVSVYGYVQGYYSKDNTKSDKNNPLYDESDIRPYVIGGSKNNQFGLDYAILGVEVNADAYRAVLKLGTGEVPEQYFPLNGLLHEAYCGFKLFDNLWFDGGFFQTNICIESYYTYENPLSIFSIPAYISEFYHTGVRLSYEPTDELTFSASLIDAYNSYGDNNKDKSIALFAEYLSENTNIYYASVIGNERPETMQKALFMHHNLNLAFYNLGKFDFISQVDLISQTHNYPTDNGLKTSYYYSLASWLSYHISDNLYCSVRYCYFDNEENPFANTILAEDLPTVKGSSIGAGITFTPTETSFVRLEGNYLDFDKNNPNSYVFQKGLENMNYRYEFLLSYGLKFNIFEKKRQTKDLSKLEP